MAHIITKLLRNYIILNFRYNKIDFDFSQLSRHVNAFMLKFRIEKHKSLYIQLTQRYRLMGIGRGQELKVSTKRLVLYIMLQKIPL